MKKIKNILLIIMILSILLSYATIVSASSTKLELVSSSKLKAGNTITVNINISNIDIEGGLTGFIGTLEYDSNVLEPITQDNVVGTNSWTVQGYSESTGKITALRNEGFTAGGNIITLTFKVKSNATATSTKISIKDVEVTGGITTGDIELATSSVTIKAETTIIPEKPSTPSTTEKTETPATPATQNPTTTTTTKQESTTATKTTLPKTGIEEYGEIIIIAVAIIGLVSYILYKKIAINVK